MFWFSVSPLFMAETSTMDKGITQEHQLYNIPALLYCSLQPVCVATGTLRTEHTGIFHRYGYWMEPWSGLDTFPSQLQPRTRYSHGAEDVMLLHKQALVTWSTALKVSSCITAVVIYPATTFLSISNNQSVNSLTHIPDGQKNNTTD